MDKLLSFKVDVLAGTSKQSCSADEELTNSRIRVRNDLVWCVEIQEELSLEAEVCCDAQELACGTVWFPPPAALLLLASVPGS